MKNSLLNTVAGIILLLTIANGDSLANDTYLGSIGGNVFEEG